MSNVATRDDVQEAVRILTVRFGLAALFIVAATIVLVAVL
jgi:hypothetical protein